jgi:hypothetical protein
MPRRIALSLTVATLLLGVGSLAPLDDLPIGSAASAQAAVNKSYSGGAGEGGNVSGAGNRLGTLLSGWAVPVLTVLAGCLLVGALASRNVGTSVGIVVITLLGLIFLLAPQTVESFAKGIASTVF